jgi:putative sterol carrier protein
VSALDRLRTATAEEARTLLREIAAEELVAAVRATSDAALLELLAREEVRPVAVTSVLARLHEFAIPERLAGLCGVVRFDLERRGRLLERHALELDHGSLRLVADVDGAAPADVVLRTSLLRFVRLVSGERNAGLEYLGGTLDIDGDEMLALAIGGIFRVPGTDRVAMDPTTLDPVDVATVLRDVRAAHLRKVMSSGFRPIVLDEIFRRLPEFVNQRKAAEVELTVGFRLLGSPTGDIERYVVHLADGVATVSSGESGGQRDATVTCEGHDYLRLATGHLNPVTGVLKGQLKIRGDRAKALQLSSVIDFPRAR